MYIPRPFQEPDIAVLQRLIQANPLGLLVVQIEGVLEAFDIPFELCPDEGEFGTLRAHIARANPLWRSLQPEQDVLVVFRGAQGYISPSWYPGKQEHHKEVPTWNYQTVQARGRIAVRDDADFVLRQITSLTRQQEAQMNIPWQVSDAPPEFIGSMLKAIVGIEIPLASLVGKTKLGQNKKSEDQAGAAQGLMAKGEVAIGEAMLASLAGRDKT
ncbi:FMN-binding negative transcriptional regulator [Cedecea lapagei]|uniref:FMN-binding negative transcriptional regulator n=1 Tax=Cedecea lapagei TaxID=158823 RepID=UPI001BCD3DC5|nr:FMN-binding negative transcriptional regulator [Cedecea lapagei]